VSRWNGGLAAGELWPGVILLALGLVVLVALLVVLLPVSTHRLTARPNPARDYAAAIGRFEAIAAAEEPVCNPAIRSLLLTHDGPTRRVYVFVHGTTNSPRQFEELGRLLHARGHTVYVPLMPRHGRRSMRLAELRGLRAEELRDYADAAVDLAAGLGEEIMAVGISGGAAIVGWMGQNRAEMHTALLLAPFLGVRRVSPAVGTAMMNVYSRMPSVNLEDPLEPRRDWVYRGQTTRALAETLRLARALLRQAAAAAPAGRRLVLLTTARETQVANGATYRLAALWRARGANVIADEFAPELEIPHNAIDPAADPAKKAIVYARMLELLGETA
jgi:carboxylesterase